MEIPRRRELSKAKTLLKGSTKLYWKFQRSWGGVVVGEGGKTKKKTSGGY